MIKRAVTYIPPIRNNNGPWIKENKLKAESFIESPVEVFTPNQEQMTHTMNNIDNQSFGKITPITPRKVAEVIRTNLTPKKTLELDLINGENLKHLLRRGILMFSVLFS